MGEQKENEFDIEAIDILVAAIEEGARRRALKRGQVLTREENRQEGPVPADIIRHTCLACGYYFIGKDTEPEHILDGEQFWCSYCFQNREEQETSQCTLDAKSYTQP